MFRRGRYCKYKGKIFICDVDEKAGDVILRSNDCEDKEKRGFVDNSHYTNNPQNGNAEIWLLKYTKDVKIEDVEWFCVIGNGGNFRGYDIDIWQKFRGKYYIYVSNIVEENSIFEQDSRFDRTDRYDYSGYVNIEEVKDVYEVKGPLRNLKAPDNWDF